MLKSYDDVQEELKFLLDMDIPALTQQSLTIQAMERELQDTKEALVLREIQDLELAHGGATSSKAGQLAFSAAIHEKQKKANQSKRVAPPPIVEEDDAELKKLEEEER